MLVSLSIDDAVHNQSALRLFIVSVSAFLFIFSALRNMYLSAYISLVPCTASSPRRPFAYTTHLTPTLPPESALPSSILRLSAPHYLFSTPMSMSDLTPSILLSLSLSLPMLCITHISLSLCNMTRDSPETPKKRLSRRLVQPQIAYGTPEYPSTFFFFSPFLTFADAHTDL